MHAFLVFVAVLGEHKSNENWETVGEGLHYPILTTDKRNWIECQQSRVVSQIRLMANNKKYSSDCYGRYSHWGTTASSYYGTIISTDCTMKEIESMIVWQIVIKVSTWQYVEPKWQALHRVHKKFTTLQMKYAKEIKKSRDHWYFIWSVTYMNMRITRP